MSADGDFSDVLLTITTEILDAARRSDWEEVNILTERREQLIASDAGCRPLTPGTEAVWQQVDRLNREALALAQTHLEHLSDNVQSTHNEQRLQKRYGV